MKAIGYVRVSTEKQADFEVSGPKRNPVPNRERFHRFPLRRHADMGVTLHHRPAHVAHQGKHGAFWNSRFGHFFGIGSFGVGLPNGKRWYSGRVSPNRRVNHSA